ncbi:MAG TPA: hypothetical protein VF748_16830 [Candidatus Acidoferrum sp.]
MATLAVPLKNCKNVAIEGWWLWFRSFLFMRIPKQARQDAKRKNRAQYPGYFYAKSHHPALKPRRKRFSAAA